MNNPECNNPVPGKRQSWLYFVQCNGEHGPVKIGYANDVWGRIERLQTGNPYQLSLLVAVRLDDACRAAEQDAHAALDRFRMRGEWFRAAPSRQVAERIAREIWKIAPTHVVRPQTPDEIAEESREREAEAVIRRAAEERETPRERSPALRKGQFVWRGCVRSSIPGG